MRRAWVEVDLGALLRNFDRLSGLAGGPHHILAMVKADAYGLGAVRVGRTLRDAGAWGLGVATVAEGAELRRAGLEERIVVFSPCPPVDAEAVVELGLEPSVSSLEGLRYFADAARPDRPLPVHVEVDTGMGRLGLRDEEAREWIRGLAAALEGSDVVLASTYTHFHSAGRDPDSVREQWERYGAVLDLVREEGIDPGLTHAANSPALLGDVGIVADLARPGIHLYGGGAHGAEPVVSVRARVVDVRTLPAGSTVGYDATWRSNRETRLATLGIGYGDGLPWKLSNRGTALVGGRTAPIRGGVCMDVTVVETTDGPPVHPGEVATLMGEDGEERITLAALARTCESMEYEILTGWGGRLPRVYREPDR